MAAILVSVLIECCLPDIYSPVLTHKRGQGVLMQVTVEQVQAALQQVVDANTGKDLVSTKSARNIKIDGGVVSLEVELGYPAKSQLEPMRKRVEAALSALPGVSAVKAEVVSRISPHGAPGGAKPVPGVKNIIAVASGKGGVGKSTTAVNLALALSAEGAKVGILDADIYGPSQPMMLGLSGKPDVVDNKVVPKERHGVRLNSIGFFVEADNPVVWRAPIATQYLEQLLRETAWGDLDYLIVDMPPGTGDIQLTLAQKVPVTGAIIVTTPQDIALMDARKGLKMFEKVNIPILGVVENMSLHICSKCGHEEDIFGSGGGDRMAKDYGIDLLGSLPLDIKIREQADSGRPTVVADPDGRAAEIYRQIARRVAVKIAEKQQDHSAAFPKIVVQNT